MIACTIEQCKRLEWFAYTHMLLFKTHKEYTRHSYHQVICQTTNKQTWDIVRHIMNVSTAVTAEQSLRLLLSIMDAIIIILLVNQSPLSFRMLYHYYHHYYKYHLSWLIMLSSSLSLSSHHVGCDQYRYCYHFHYYLISFHFTSFHFDQFRRHGPSTASFILILSIILIIIMASWSWSLWPSFFSHHTIMIIIILFQYSSYNDDGYYLKTSWLCCFLQVSHKHLSQQ